MSVAYVSTFAALAGSMVGGFTSVFSSWLNQSAQLKSQIFLNEKCRKQKLYRAFVEEASNLYIDSLTREAPDLAKIVALYALISSMRVLSSPVVTQEAVMVVRLILRSYNEPNKTIGDINAMMNEHMFDPLRGFSESCRDELAKPR